VAARYGLHDPWLPKLMADGTDGVLHSQSQDSQTTRASASTGAASSRGTPAKFVDYVEAPDAKTAEDIADKHRSRIRSGTVSLQSVRIGEGGCPGKPQLAKHHHVSETRRA
jgi:hypothetical protein